MAPALFPKDAAPLTELNVKYDTLYEINATSAGEEQLLTENDNAETTGVVLIGTGKYALAPKFTKADPEPPYA